MARTLTYQDALNILAQRHRQFLADGTLARFCDEVMSFMWNRYPWTQTLDELPPFYLTYGESRYGTPVAAIPADFKSLHEAQVVGYSTGEYPLKVLKTLQESSVIAPPEAISYDKAAKQLVVFPASSFASPQYWVTGKYKKTPTKVTNATLASVLPFEDDYFAVFRTGLAAKIRQELLDDPRWPTYWQQFLFLLDKMAQEEGFNEGQLVVAPDDELALGG